MTDAQFGILIATLATFLSGVIGMLKWAVTRITHALDENTKSNKEDAEAKIHLAREMAVLSTKIDLIAQWVQEHTPVNQPVPTRRPTPSAGVQGPGYYSTRKPTRDG